MDPRTGLVPTTCPYCGYTLDAATAADQSNARPRAGDVTVCFKCTGILEYTNETGSVTKVSLDHVPHKVRHEIQQVQGAIRRMRHLREKLN